MAFKFKKATSSGGTGAGIGALTGIPGGVTTGALIGSGTSTKSTFGKKSTDRWNKALDPGDLFGTQANNRREEVEKNIQAERDIYDQLMKERPEYKQSIWETKQYEPEYYKMIQGIQSNIGPGSMYTSGSEDVGKLRERAFGTEQSPWLQSLLSQQQAEEQTGIEDLSRQQALSGAEAEAQLAASGGLESGARERLAMNMGRGGMEQLQTAKRQGQLQRLGLMSDEEARRMQLQQQLPGMQLSYDQYSTGLQNANRDYQFNKANQWMNMQQTEADRLSRANQMKQMAQLSAWQEKVRGIGAQRESDYLARMGSPTGSILERMI